MTDLYHGYNIDQRDAIFFKGLELTPEGWYVGINHPDGYDESGPFQTKEAAMEWVDQHQLERGLAQHLQQV